MANSLQEQLLKAGLVDDKTLKQSDKQKRKQEKVQRKSRAGVQEDEVKKASREALQAKANKDRELNQALNDKAQKKAIRAQIKQLMESHEVKDQGEAAYNFTDGKKIKKIYVTETMINQLSRGTLAIAKLGDSYKVIPAAIAEKIAQRDENYILVRNERSATETVDEDDPYADYPIPDDLMW